MMRKLFAAGALAGMVVIGAIAIANAAPNAGGSGPFLSNSTTSTTPTTSATNAPAYPGRMGY